MKDMAKVWLYKGKVYCTLKHGIRGTYIVNVSGVTKVGYQ